MFKYGYGQGIMCGLNTLISYQDTICTDAGKQMIPVEQKLRVCPIYLNVVIS